MLATLVSGQHSDRFRPTATEPGQYQVDLTFIDAGIYKIYFEIPSLNMKIDDLPFVTIQVTNK